MTIKTFGGCISGLDAELVTVEVQVQSGLPRFSIVGLGDSAVQESRERVLAALAALRGSIEIELPDQILVNLSPADLRKVGSSLDLAIAAGIAAAVGIIDPALVKNTLFFGELSLSGEVKSVKGAIAYAILAKKKNLHCLVCPSASVHEASLIDSVSMIGVASLFEVFSALLDQKPYVRSQLRIATEHNLPNPFQSIIGQHHAKRAMVIAAAGGHHMLMAGPPGCGKTMIAQGITALLPPLNESEVLELVSIHSVAGSDITSLLHGIPPFRAPHYNVSQAGLVGGGSRIRPGEVTLAHGGVLFLDEFPEFSRSVIEALRLPLESRHVQISRAIGTHIFPARFQLVVAMNPCPCGLFGYSEKCRCSSLTIDKYQKRISAAILDRIDMHIGMEPVSAQELLNVDEKPICQDCRADVRRVRQECFGRYASLSSEIKNEQLLSLVSLSPQVKHFLILVSEKFSLSARSINKLIKVALTISLLNSHAEITPDDIAEALSYRVRIGKEELTATYDAVL